MRLAVLAVCFAVALPGLPALAQAPAPPAPPVPEAQPEATPGNPMLAPDKVPRPPRGDKTKNLDFLFEALKAAPDADSAKLVEARIWAIWLASGSDTADLLMTRVKAAVDKKDVPLAIKLLDAIIDIRPDYVEAWNRRATLHFMQKDIARSLEDIRQVLVREPRHFGALFGLGMILQEFGSEKRALEIFRRALAVNPHLPRVPDLIKTLTEKVEGRDI